MYIQHLAVKPALTGMRSSFTAPSGNVAGCGRLWPAMALVYGRLWHWSTAGYGTGLLVYWALWPPYRLYWALWPPYRLYWALWPLPLIMPAGLLFRNYAGRAAFP